MSSTDSPPPGDERERQALLAAFEIGRRLNAVRHHMIWAWCCIDSARAHCAEECFNALAPLIPRATLRDLAAEAVRTIDEECVNWRSAFGSAEHADASTFAKSSLIRLGEFPASRPPREAHDVVADFLVPPKAVYSILARSINNCFDDRLRHFVSLGRELDEGMHSPDLPCPSVIQQASVNRNTPQGLPADAWNPDSCGNRGVSHNLCVSYEECTRTGRKRWYENLMTCWGGCGLPGELPTPNSTVDDDRIEATFVELCGNHVRRTIKRWGLRPEWDSVKYELRVGAMLARRILARSKNQIKVLNTFQECEWANRVDSPFQKNDSTLHETIRTMNDGLELIVFHADGAGAGITWEWRDPT